MILLQKARVTGCICSSLIKGVLLAIQQLSACIVLPESQHHLCCYQVTSTGKVRAWGGGLII